MIRTPPKAVSDTAIVTIAATVMTTLRRRLPPVSRSTYGLAIVIGCPFSYLAGPAGPLGVDHAVDASCLVAHNIAPVQFDDPLAHSVDDILLVGRHNHRGAVEVDAFEKPHNAGSCARVEVPCRL